MKYKYIVGVDEVGRGPLAGPVFVCCSKIAVKDVENLVSESGLPLRDSKKLTEIMRKKWFAYLEKKRKEGIFDYKVSSASANQIDNSGIAVCISGCIAHSLERLISQENLQDIVVLLDGGLKAPKEYSQQTIIRGDEGEASIALASIVAKVLRDELMEKIHEKFPEYGFDRHKGYGTAQHIKTIREKGTCEEHRVSFLKNI